MNRLTINFAVACLCTFGVTFTTFADDIFVNGRDNIGPFNGNSWTTAYRHLQDALDEADGNDVIKVAGHSSTPTRYFPDRGDVWSPPSNHREASFDLRPGDVVLGGYAGSPTQPDLRNPAVYKSILTGDLEENDDPEDADSFDDNSYHVVTIIDIPTTAIQPKLEGFTIERGNIDGLDDGPTCGSQGSPGPGGAGLMCVSASPTIRNCIFKSNHGQFGGGVLLFCESNPIISLCTFDSNVADHDGLGNGGGMYMFYNCAPNVVSCRFVNNTSIHIGGGVAFQELCTPQFTQCVFAGNQTGNNSGNDWGGGMRVGFDCSATIRFCVFYDNSCIGSNCKGGGFAANRDNPPDDGDILIDSCIFMDNTAASGPEMYRDDDAGVTITISHCNVEGGQGGVVGDFVWGDGNFYDDPRFVNAGAGNFDLDPDSPCIDAGSNEGYPNDAGDVNGNEDPDEPLPWDLGGAERFCHQQMPDVGAYEGEPECPADISEAYGEVDVDDMLVVINNWGDCPDLPESCPGDIFPPPCGDGVVDNDDLYYLTEDEWGSCGESFGPGGGLPEWLEACLENYGEDIEALIACIVENLED